MPTNEKIFDVLEGLREKSQAGQVRWKEGTKPNEFFVSFSNHFHLSLQLIQPPTLADLITISLRDNNWKELWSLDVNEGDDEWQVAIDLFNHARSQVYHLEDVIGQMIRELTDPGPVGTK